MRYNFSSILNRVKAYVTEAGGPLCKSWWQRRHVVAQVPFFHSWLELPSDKGILSKDLDPNWRKSRGQWVLLTYDGGYGCHVFHAEDFNRSTAMRTLLPVPTRLFAMRISDKPLQVLVLSTDGISSPRVPSFYDCEGSDSVVQTYQQILSLTDEKEGLQVTFI